MEKIKEEVPEKLRIAVLLSFISGYINAFTYNNAGELFAGAQTGNVIFIKQCKNTRDSSIRRVLVMRHVLVGYKLHENFSKHIGKLVCRHGEKLCNKETELLGTLKASITTT